MSHIPLRIGMVGYGFMGRAHSNGYSQANHFFDLKYKPVLKAVAARNAEKARAFAAMTARRKKRKAWKLPGGPHLRLCPLPEETAGWPGVHTLAPQVGPTPDTRAQRCPKRGVPWRLECLRVPGTSMALT